MNYLQIKEEIEIKNEGSCDFSTKFFPCATKYLQEYSCKKCDYSSHLKVDFAIHEHSLKRNKLVKTSEKYSCPKCYNFDSYSFLIFAKHKYEKCPTEAQSETSNIEWSAHSSSQDEEFYCKHCDYVSAFKQSLVRHLNAKHLPPERIKWFKCDQCDFNTQHIGSLQRHRAVLHCPSENIVWLKCEFCPFQAKYKRYLVIHVKRKHTDSHLWHHCGHCSYRAMFACHLKDHIISKHTASEDIEWFRCEHCPYKAKQRNCLNVHVKNKHTEPKYVCDRCPYKAKNVGRLNSHVSLMHANPRDIVWFRCDFCYYCAKRKEDLERHVGLKHSKTQSF